MLEAQVFLQKYQRELSEKAELWPGLKEKYRLTECLREGDDRKVYLAEGKDGKTYVLKIRASGRPDSLRREYQIISDVSHPQIPKPVAYLEEEGREYLVRTYIQGQSLQDIICQEGALPENQIAGIMLSLCDVLRYLHEQKPPVIHRDIKPQNVILTPEGKCVLIDFGTARQYQETAEEDTVFMGTPAVAPPEQFGYGQTDERTDIYAVGMLFRFLRTGRLDSLKRGDASLIYRRIAKKCTAFDPKRRFGKIRGLARMLHLFTYRKVIFFVLTLAAVFLFTAAIAFHKEEEVYFQSTLLEEAVRQELGLKEGVPIPKNRLGEVVQLILCGNEIVSNWSLHKDEHDAKKVDSTLWNGSGNVSNLTELDQLPNLEILVLDDQNISDITPLKGRKLRYLSLCGNQITDLSALKDMDTLEKLWLENNPVSDAAVLASLSSLHELIINETDIEDAESFCSLPLRILKMRDTLIKDVTPLQGLKSLQSLVVWKVDEQGLEIIQSLHNLTFLAVSSRMENLEGFSDLIHLNMLDVSDSSLKSLKGIERLPRLKYFGFGYTKPESLEPLTENDTLETVEMAGADIEDYTPLLRCKNLRTVHVGFSQEKEVKSQLAGSGLEILAWEE